MTVIYSGVYLCNPVSLTCVKDSETLVSILALCYSNIFCYNIILSSVLPFNDARLLVCSPISLSSVFPG